MVKILSNGPSRDYVLAAFQKFSASSSEAFLAAPYFSYADPLIDTLKTGCKINLLVCLNPSTHPDALRAVSANSRVRIRYFTGRFHAKIFVFDNAAMLGSANLTQAGFGGNREAVACFSSKDESDAVDDVRGLFTELWESADVLTPEILSAFRAAWFALPKNTQDADRIISDAVGRAEPTTISVQKPKNASERLFLQGLRRKIHEQYGRAFDEVARVLQEENLERGQLTGLARPFHTNRFLNWVRLEKAPGEGTWLEAPIRDEAGRREELRRLGTDWRSASDDRVPNDYEDRLRAVDLVFGTRERLSYASKDDLMDGILGLHAFSEQLRFVKGGLSELPKEFWRENAGDIDRVRASLDHLLFGTGDFVARLHDNVYSPKWKLRMFGQFCSTELAGTVRPDLCPPVNGRTAKALRFVGFDVPGQ